MPCEQRRKKLMENKSKLNISPVSSFSVSLTALPANQVMAMQSCCFNLWLSGWDRNFFVCAYRGKGMFGMRRKDHGAAQQICPNKEIFSSMPPSLLLPSSLPLTSHQLKPKTALRAQALPEGTNTCWEKHKCWRKGRRDLLKFLKNMSYYLI